MSYANCMRLHHLQKKTHHKHLRVPLSYKNHVWVDSLALFAGIASPVMTLPQVLTIYVARSSAGVSLPTWASYIGISSIWLFYGVMHKEKAVLLSSSLGILLDVIIVVGIMRT